MHHSSNRIAHTTAFVTSADIKDTGINVMPTIFTRLVTPFKMSVLRDFGYLFTDNARDRKDMESYLIEKLGSRKSGGVN